MVLLTNHLNMYPPCAWGEWDERNPLTRCSHMGSTKFNSSWCHVWVQILLTPQISLVNVAKLPSSVRWHPGSPPPPDPPSPLVQVGAISGTSASKTCSNFKMKSGCERAGKRGARLWSSRGGKWRLTAWTRWGRMWLKWWMWWRTPPTRVMLPGARASWAS